MLKSRFSQFILVAFASVVFHACVDDNNAEPDLPGADRDKFVGNWLCKETITGTTPTTFTINIQKYGSNDSLVVYNFNNLGSPYYAYWIVSGNSVTIPAQTITQVDISGTGIFNNSKINLSYNSDGESVSAECTKQ
jgi:hypothetical protein